MIGAAPRRAPGSRRYSERVNEDGYFDEHVAATYDDDGPMFEPAAFRLTAFFLHRHVYEPRGLDVSSARDGFVHAALKALKAQSSAA